jgi:hypothetical protein
MTLNCFIYPLTFFFLIMSKSVMISLLKQGQTGDEILSILDTLIEEQEYDNQPTLEEIKF